MTRSPLAAPQLITNSRMLYLCWVPEDPDAAKALVPAGLTPDERGIVYMNQYVVDDPKQTSNGGLPGEFGAYSLTYLGVELQGLDAQPGIPGRWWTHYFNSSENMSGYAADRGLPAEPGQTVLEFEGDTLVATTSLGGVPIIRTTCDVRIGNGFHSNGQLRYITKVDGSFVSGRYPFVMRGAEHFEAKSIEFLQPDHPVNALRPASPLDITFGFYSPDISFCYPGGEGPMGVAPHGV